MHVLTWNSDNNNRYGNNQDIDEFLAPHSTISLRVVRNVCDKSKEQNEKQDASSPIKFN
jgi:hypothetical protein